MALAARLYRAALTPLKLTVREMARGRLVVKLRLQSTKQTVLNQQILQPESKHSANTYEKLAKNQVNNNTATGEQT